jgi:hypothetical protein
MRPSRKSVSPVEVAAVPLGRTIAVLGQLGRFVTGLCAVREYVATALLPASVVCGLVAVLGCADGRPLRTTAVGD